MNYEYFQAEAPPPPPGRTPKSLSKQVANAFALMVINRSLPALIKYWGIDYKQKDSEVYLERDDYDMEDEDGSDDDEATDDGEIEMLEEKRIGQVVVQHQEHDAQVVVVSDHRNIASEIRDVREVELVVQEALVEQVPPLSQEIVIGQEAPVRQHAIISEEIRLGPEVLLVKEAVIQTPTLVSQTELSKQIILAAELLRRGMEALILAEDLEEFDDDDSDDFLFLRPRVAANRGSDDSTSGSGRIRTPDEGEIPTQDPEQIEYLNKAKNSWVQNASNIFLLKHLKRLKRWYDKVIASGHGGSLMHWLISEALTDVLDCVISSRVCSPFYRYNLQVLFSQQVGFLGQENMEEVPSVWVCRAYANFLKQLKPFNMRTLFTIPMAFAHPAPITVILKNSRYLKKISVNIMLCRPILKCLRKHCKKMTEISVFAGGPFGDAGLTENFMFLTFFSGMFKSEVIRCIDRRSEVNPSFPDLERLQLHFLSEAHHHFIHCMQHFFPWVKTQFVYLITDSVMSPSTLGSKLRPPYFLQGKGVYSWDSLYIMPGRLRFMEDASDRDKVCGIPSAKVNCLSVWNKERDSSPRAALIREIVTRYGCSSLVLRMPYVYLDDEVNIITPYLGSIGKYLTELRVLSTRSAFNASELVAGLNACQSLKLFSLDVACFWPLSGSEILELNELPELVSLSITANVLIDIGYVMEEENLKLARFLGNVILKAPALRTLELLRTPGDIVVQTMTEVGRKTSIQTLVVDGAFFRNLEFKLDYLVTFLPSLSHLLLYSISSQTYLRIKKRYYLTGLQIVYRSKKLLGAEEIP